MGREQDASSQMTSLYLRAPRANIKEEITWLKV